MKIFPIIFFFAFVLAFLFATHYFVYFSLSKFLNFSLLQRRILGASFLVLTVGFVGSALFSHYVDNIMSQALYSLTSTWLGLFSNLVWAVIIFWPLYLLLQKTIAPKYLLVVMAVLCAGILLLTVVGLRNAQRINFRQEQIKINNLPAWWQGKKIVQLSDAHLNNIHDEKFLEPIVERINQEKVAAVFLTGDFFDGMDGRLENLATPLKQLETEKGIYFISGNHEMYMGLDKATQALTANGVIVLDDSKVAVEGLEIAGLRFPERDGLRRDLVQEIEKLDLKAPSIFLYHDPRQVEEVAATGRVSLMLSGHTHNGQLWPYNFVVRWIYGKYAVGLHRLGEMTHFTSIGAGTWGPPMRTTGQPEVVIFTLE